MNVPVTLVRTGGPTATADAFLLPDADAARLGERLPPETLLIPFGIVQREST